LPFRHKLVPSKLTVPKSEAHCEYDSESFSISVDGLPLSDSAEVVCFVSPVPRTNRNIEVVPLTIPKVGNFAKNDSDLVISRATTVVGDVLADSMVANAAVSDTDSSRELGESVSIVTWLAAMVCDAFSADARVSNLAAWPTLLIATDSASTRFDHDATSALAAARRSALSDSSAFTVTAEFCFDDPFEMAFARLKLLEALCVLLVAVLLELEATGRSLVWEDGELNESEPPSSKSPLLINASIVVPS